MTEPSIPVPAATVVLVRSNHKRRFDIYLNRRPEQMATYAGVCVFPGGRVEASDGFPEVAERTSGITALEAQQTLGVRETQQSCLAYWVAAARELFEESGVHFFYPRDKAPGTPLPEKIAGRLTTKRAQLQTGETDWLELLRSEDLFCDLAPLSYFFHRVTPEHYPIRFDTRFFLAVLPDDQHPLPASEEVSESFWMTPSAALERAAAGDIRMMPPTLAVLRTLDAHPTWDDLRDAFGLARQVPRSQPIPSFSGKFE